MTATAHSIGAAVGFALVLTLCMRLLRQIKYEGAPRVEAPTWGDDLGCVLATALLSVFCMLTVTGLNDHVPILPMSWVEWREVLEYSASIALAFGLESMRYSFGSFIRPGPGLFPLIVATLLLLIGLATVVRSRFVERVHLDINLKNIAIILASLSGFALLSQHLNMLVGITFMVFCAAFAGSSYSIVRNLKVAAGLMGVALAFHKLLGLNLPLY